MGSGAWRKNMCVCVCVFIEWGTQTTRERENSLCVWQWGKSLHHHSLSLPVFPDEHSGWRAWPLLSQHAPVLSSWYNTMFSLLSAKVGKTEKKQGAGKEASVCYINQTSLKFDAIYSKLYSKAWISKWSLKTWKFSISCNWMQNVTMLSLGTNIVLLAFKICFRFTAALAWPPMCALGLTTLKFSRTKLLLPLYS